LSTAALPINFYQYLRHWNHSEGVSISGSNAKPGDKVILSGTIGDHGIAVLSKREGLSFSTNLESDCAPLAGMVADMLKAGRNIHSLRDPTAAVWPPR